MNLNAVEKLCNFSSFILCIFEHCRSSWDELKVKVWTGNCLYSSRANTWKTNASCYRHGFWRHGCHSSSQMSCTSSLTLVPPMERTTAAVSHHLFGCEFPRFVPCRGWVAPAIAGSSNSSCCRSVPTVLLLSSCRNRSPPLSTPKK